jgi:hypothetical protein
MLSVHLLRFAVFLMLWLSMPMLAEAKGEPTADEWRPYCELFPTRCDALRKQCAAHPEACEKAKTRAAERKAIWEQRCEQNPQRCEARKKRRMEAMSRCNDDPEACAEASVERRAALKDARLACEDFTDEAERKQCIAHRLKKQAPGNAPSRGIKGKGAAAGEN